MVIDSVFFPFKEEKKGIYFYFLIGYASFLFLRLREVFDVTMLLQFEISDIDIS